ncbi:MAG: hypothetical protein JKY42_05425, partial [Flavobacteriales bacterium]|nr:hypothetical protein [Flavobacteriales bacterium]
MRLIIYIALFLPYAVIAQLNVSMYFPDEEKIIDLGITKMRAKHSWLEFEKKDTIIRNDFINHFDFNEKGQKVLRQKFGWGDTLKVYEKETFTYDSIGNLILRLKSRPWLEQDSSEVISVKNIYNKGNQIIIEHRIWSYIDQNDSVRTRSVLKYRWYKKERIVKDSSITNYGSGKRYTVRKEYVYENELLQTEILLKDTTNNRYKNYYYENNRLKKVTVNDS